MREFLEVAVGLGSARKKRSKDTQRRLRSELYPQIRVRHPNASSCRLGSHCMGFRIGNGISKSAEELGALHFKLFEVLLF